MTGAARQHVARGLTVVLWVAGAAIIFAALLAAKERVHRELHERLPASTWLVVESVDPTEPRIAPGDPLVFRIRALRHRDYTARRTAVLSCRAESGMLSGIWRQVGDPQRLQAQSVGPAVIGYADDQPVPESLSDAERLPGIEVWPGEIPAAGHECVIALRWPIETPAGAGHVVTENSTPVVIGARPVLEPEAVNAPAPHATELLEQVEERPDGPAPATLEQTIAPKPMQPIDQSSAPHPPLTETDSMD